MTSATIDDTDRLDAPVGDPEELTAPSGGPLRLIASAFAQNRLALVGVGLVIALVLFCFVGPLFYHSSQVTPILDRVNDSPGRGAPLGDDNEGFDILGRLMVGGRISLEIAFLVGLVAMVVGVVYGAVAGYFGKVVDGVMMRVVDVFLAIPTIYFYLDLSGVFHATGELLLIAIIAGLSWLGPSRLVRGEVLTLRSREYVKAARSMGGSPARIIFRHLVPNAIGTIVVQATFLIADAILILTTLEYLGLGLPSTIPTWGDMLNSGSEFISDGYWWELYPVVGIIVIAIVAFNLIGDALRDSLDVRLQQR